MGSMLLAAVLAATPDAPAPSETPLRQEALAPKLWRDVALAAGASAAIAMGKADIRRAIWRDGRLSNVIDNFASPIAQVRRGTRRDVDPFWVNNVAHPASFAIEAVYLKRRGYSDGAAFVFTQVHSVVWEFVIEGCAFEPSGKDLLTDAIGAAAGIWLVHPLTKGARGSDAPVQIALSPKARGAQLVIRF